jgi:hypothetical protein
VRQYLYKQPHTHPDTFVFFAPTPQSISAVSTRSNSHPRHSFTRFDTFTMKYTTTILALVAAVAAQSIADLPSCSLSCVLQGVQGTGCSTTDFACSCQKADVLTPIVTPCVQSACPDAADQAKVISTLEGICAGAGFPINVPEPAPSSAEPSAEPTVETSGTFNISYT